MSTPTVLHDTDAGAPALTGEDGSGYDVIKWAAQELGWTIEFDDEPNSKIVIRSNPAKGPGRYYRFRDQAADHGQDAKYMAVESFASMTDIDTGTDGYPSSDRYFLKSLSASSTGRGYTVVGTDHHLWFLPNHSGNGDDLRLVYFLGDGASYMAGDTSFALLAASQSDGELAKTSTEGGLCMTAVTNMRTAVASNFRTIIEDLIASTYDGVGIGADAHPVTQSPNVASEDFWPGSRGTYPDPITGSINTSRVELAEDTGSGVFRRGQFVGLMNPMCDMRVNSQSDYVTGDVISSIAGAQGVGDALFVFAFAARDTVNDDYMGAILFDLSSDWDDWL